MFSRLIAAAEAGKFQKLWLCVQGELYSPLTPAKLTDMREVANSGAGFDVDTFRRGYLEELAVDEGELDQWFQRRANWS
jgi:hypothetical protein